MGKGFNNYMCKKFFHPSSRDNLKRVWIAEQKTEAEKKKQEELRLQYEKEQELYNNKALLAKGQNKDKLSLNFMYDPPAGVRKEHEKEDGEQEYRFEWQRKYNAPRESYCKDDDTIRDQPFGIAVRNVRCIKCKKWGHINTDKECPLYGRVIEPTEEAESFNVKDLSAGMQEDGLRLKTMASLSNGIYGNNQDPKAYNQQLVSDDEGLDSKSLLKSLTLKEKKRLFKKLKKMEKHEKKKKSKKMKKKSRSSSSNSDSSSDSEKERYKKRKKKSSKKDSNERKKQKSKPKEIVDPESLLKEITKGLKVDFVGHDNPFSETVVNIKQEKDDQMDSYKSRHSNGNFSARVKQEPDYDNNDRGKNMHIGDSHIDNLLREARSKCSNYEQERSFQKDRRDNSHESQNWKKDGKPYSRYDSQRTYQHKRYRSDSTEKTRDRYDR